jgi:hypothetical protein
VWTLIINALVGLAGALLKTYMTATPPIVGVAQSLGQAQQVATEDQQALDDIAKSQAAARAAANPDPASLRAPDPDSRD